LSLGFVPPCRRPGACMSTATVPPSSSASSPPPPGSPRSVTPPMPSGCPHVSAAFATGSVGETGQLDLAVTHKVLDVIEHLCNLWAHYRRST
jgi:hypothetical protein